MTQYELPTDLNIQHIFILNRKRYSPDKIAKEINLKLSFVKRILRSKINKKEKRPTVFNWKDYEGNVIV